MENLDVIVHPLRAFLVEIGAYLPRLAVAIVVLVAGWLIAKAVRFAVVKALRALNFHVLTERAGGNGRHARCNAGFHADPATIDDRRV